MIGSNDDAEVSRKRTQSAPHRIHIGEMVMRPIAILSVLAVSLGVNTSARAQQTKDCKLCREYQQACLKNHTRDACNNEYNICMKYCGKK